MGVARTNPRRSPKRQSGSPNADSRRPSGEVSLVEARLRVRLPRQFAWTDFLSRHPELVVDATHRYITDARHVVVEICIRGQEAHDWSAELRTTSNVVSVVRLDRSGRPGTYRMKWNAPPFLVRIYEKYDMVGFIPFVVTLDHVELTLALSRPRLQRLVRELRRRNFEPEVDNVRPLRGRIPLGGLTRKQRERFQMAVESGYFDVPRRVTLSELARRLAVRKSALSESLGHARRKVLTAAGRAMLLEDALARAALFGTA